MRRVFLLPFVTMCVLVTIWGVGPQRSWALPAPKSEAEMMSEADLVVDANCIEIVCDGKPVQQTGYVETFYLSTFQLVQSYKGGTPKSFQILGSIRVYAGPPPIGGWFQEPVPEGWSGKLYLKLLSDGTYTKIWWNANIEDANSKPLPLPVCDGESIDPDGVAPKEAIPDPEPSTQDASAPDAMPPDPTEPDAMPPDPTEPDVMPPDQIQQDIQAPDAAQPDTTPEASQPDTAISPDSGEPITAKPDASASDDLPEQAATDTIQTDTTPPKGCSCDAAQSATFVLWPVILMLFFILFKRSQFVASKI
jgi:hypothetical protein